MPPAGSTKYADLDDTIVQAVAAGRNTFAAIRGFPKVRDLSQGDERKVDARLQSLRRKKRLTYTGQAKTAGWKLPKDTNE